MLQGNPNGPNHLKLLQVGLRSKRTTVQTIQIVQIALCWLQNFDCFISVLCSPVIWFLSKGSLELNRLTQASGSILAGHAQISRAKF